MSQTSIPRLHHNAASVNSWCFDPMNTLDESLIALLNLRASQINGCLLCVHHHFCRAQKAGVSVAKLASVEARRCAAVFSRCEKAVLAWAEYRAGVARTSASDSVWASLKSNF